MPIDSAYPEERIAYMLEDSARGLLLVYGDGEVPQDYERKRAKSWQTRRCTRATPNVPAASRAETIWRM
ncbi:hypothetical protein ACFTAO_51420 [Paenibacillus rhizoplanae]